MAAPVPHPLSTNSTLGTAFQTWMHEFASNGILLTDENLHVRSCNVWLAKQIGSPESDLIGRHLFELFPEIQKRGFDRYYREALVGQSRILSHRLHRYLLPMAPATGAGSYAQMQQSARISPLSDGEKIVGTITLIEDVTDRVTREHELNAQLEERDRLLASELSARELAETNSRIKDDFLAAVSHEIRAPLNAITGWTQLLVNGGLGEQEKTHALDTIQRNVKSQTQIIEDLLDISRIVAGQMRLDLKPHDLIDSIDSTYESVMHAAKAKEIRIVRSVPLRSPLIMGDSSRLQQVVWNLMTNAVKFTQSGGQVEVTLREVNDFAELTVADNGPGISSEFLPYVFDRFRQAEGGSRRRQGGLGLGLSIVKNLVEMHGGMVSVESRGEGSGTAFTVMIPVLLSERGRSSIADSSAESGQDHVNIAGCRILIVEDDDDSREMLERLLTTLSAETATAATAAEAMDLFSSFKPEILISDLGLPEFDGYDLIKRIRGLSAEEGGSVPALALTGFASAEEKRRVRSAGFDDHLAKPVEFEKLIEIIGRLWSRPAIS
jgi:PAS domain S-box-containing protein